jgi:hypothetical protein
MILMNMAATCKKGLLLLGLATAVLATPVMGIEVRHDNLTSPCDSCCAQTQPLSFARSLAFDCLSCVSCIHSFLLDGVAVGVVIVNWGRDTRILTSS